MRKRCAALLIMLCTTMAGMAQSDSLTNAVDKNMAVVTKDTLLGSLKVTVKGLRIAGGTALVALYNRSQGFTKNLPLKNAAVPVKAAQLTLQFDSLGKGSYAVAIIHDENGNGLLDKNDMGIPVEGYGFSNDARGAFGPPEYKDAKFWFSGQDRTIVINMFYTNAKR